MNIDSSPDLTKESPADLETAIYYTRQITDHFNQSFSNYIVDEFRSGTQNASAQT